MKTPTEGEKRLHALIEGEEGGDNDSSKFGTLVLGVLETLKFTKQVLLEAAEDQHGAAGGRGGEFGGLERENRV